MKKENGIAVTEHNDGLVALAWLRHVLTSVLDVSPLPLRLRKRTANLPHRLPDWLLRSWATALNIDYVSACKAVPDLAERVRSDSGRGTVSQYFDTHGVVPLANSLQQVVGSVTKHPRSDTLPVDKETIEKQVCALALASCTPDGAEFAAYATSILSGSEQANHLLINYQLALDSGQKQKLEEVDVGLVGGRYGEWVAERLYELKRWLGLDSPQFRVQYGQRTSQWDSLWRNMILGGEDD